MNFILGSGVVGGSVVTIVLLISFSLKSVSIVEEIYALISTSVGLLRYSLVLANIFSVVLLVVGIVTVIGLLKLFLTCIVVVIFYDLRKKIKLMICFSSISSKAKLRNYPLRLGKFEKR